MLEQSGLLGLARPVKIYRPPSFTGHQNKPFVITLSSHNSVSYLTKPILFQSGDNKTYREKKSNQRNHLHLVEVVTEKFFFCLSLHDNKCSEQGLFHVLLV